jgi:hypothetical protein
MAFGKRTKFAPLDTDETIKEIERNTTPLSFKIAMMSVVIFIPAAVLIMIVKIILA